MWRIILFLLCKSISGDDFFTGVFTITDQCINICKEKKLDPLELENYEQIVCQRGCRFYNIIHFKDELNENTTKKGCYLSCNESYLVKNENVICKQGCDFMAQHRQNEISKFIILTDEAEANEIILAEPDVEILESDLFSDPSIKSQLEIGFGIDYKIPETRIITMPIEFHDDSTEDESNNNAGDWLDCASRNSGIPRWILLMTILSAILLALWLSLSTVKKNNEDFVQIDVSDEFLILPQEEDDLKSVSVGSGKILPTSNSTKYVVESEKV